MILEVCIALNYPHNVDQVTQKNCKYSEPLATLSQCQIAYRNAHVALMLQVFQEPQRAQFKRCSIRRQAKQYIKQTLRSSNSSDSVQQSATEGQLPPWHLGFQCNERYLRWGDNAQTQLLKIYAARELGKVCLLCMFLRYLPWSMEAASTTILSPGQFCATAARASRM